MLNIHALCGIRNNDPGYRASEDNTCFIVRPLDYRDRQQDTIIHTISPCRMSVAGDTRALIFIFIWHGDLKCMSLGTRDHILLPQI
jgi:hypothetical protein